jgi:hypothetical protein
LTKKRKRESMTHLSGVTLDETGVDGVGEGEGGEVTLELVGLNLVGGESRGGGEGLGRVDVERGGLVGDDGNELVVDDLDL